MQAQEKTKYQIPIKATAQWKLDKFLKAPIALAGPVPKYPLDVIKGFKIINEIDTLKKSWKRMRGGEHYDPAEGTPKIGMIFDQTQQVALIVDEAGIECLRLRVTLASSTACVENKTEREIQADIRRGKQSGNVVFYGKHGFDANLMELLVKSLKLNWISGEEGYYSIVSPSPKKDASAVPLLVVRNNVTLMLGVIAPRKEAGFK